MKTLKKAHSYRTYSIISGDSVEQEMFDKEGNSVYIKVLGISDSIKVGVDAQEPKLYW